MIGNLVENAVKHGEGTIHVRLLPIDGHVRLRVDDEGEGPVGESIDVKVLGLSAKDARIVEQRAGLERSE